MKNQPAYFNRPVRSKKVDGDIVKTRISWWHEGQPYSIEIDLSDELYERYKNRSKNIAYKVSEGPPADWEENLYNRFITPFPEDKTFSVIADYLKKKGKSNGLESGQLPELVMSFVRSIPYDTDGADRILKEKQDMRYPYEVLYDGEGTCSGKSFLAVAILDELGYGRALFSYDEANHLAVGLKTPSEYSNYNSGYSYSETTVFGIHTGVVPRMGTGKNPLFSSSRYEDSASEINISPDILGPVEIYCKKDGKTYTGIISTMKKRDEIIKLENKIDKENAELQSKEKEFKKDERDLKRLKDKLYSLKKRKNYKEYNKKVKEYNKIAKKNKEEVRKYNKSIKVQNKRIKKFNRLKKEIYRTFDKEKTFGRTE